LNGWRAAENHIVYQMFPDLEIAAIHQSHKAILLRIAFNFSIDRAISYFKSLYWTITKMIYFTHKSKRKNCNLAES